ncbi:response regulator [Sphingomonas sp. R1]|uniref:response regulator n=1 Tax=Sphingomonas sp. R1 TaxID=399176 RepID=UPI00222433BD|nr:response regulator [Sphingomonas sp. R1]UYY78959.1 response regulator [Sphingomonas sp. R1]
MGLRVLIVEDEMTIAFLIEDMLEDLGHEVVEIAMRLPEALEAARRVDADLAILDVNLDGHRSFPVADILEARSIPFAFATGYGALGLEGPYRERPVLAKPFLREHLATLIAKACG